MSPAAAALLLALALVVATAAAEAQAAPPDLVPVTYPSLEAMEPSVRAQLEAARGRLEAERGSGGEALGAAYGDLGELYLVYDLVDPAAACLENAARLDPGELRWPHLLGTLHEHDRRLEDAARWYRRASTVDPSYLPARLRLGKVLVLQGEDDAARRALEGVAASPAAIPPLVAAAEAWLGRLELRSNPRAAIAHLERALELQPQASALHYPLSQAYRAVGEPEQARTQLEARGDRDVGFPDRIALEVRSRASGVGAEMVLARAALRSGDVAAAEVALRRAVELDRTSPHAHRYLGEILARAGRFEEAAPLLERAVSLDPDDVSQRLALAGVLAALGRDRDAVAALEPAVAAAPAYAPARARLGATLARLGEDEGAARELGQAVALDPSDSGSRWLYGLALLRLGRAAEARPQLERLVADLPASAPAHALLATALLELGAEAEATVELELAVRLDPDDVESRARLARALGRQGRYLEAAEQQRQVVARDPSAVEAQLVLATARLLGGDYAAAAAGLESALAVTPGDPRLGNALSRVLSSSPEAAVRDGARALALAESLYQAVPGVDTAETLSLALAEVGRFEEAAALVARVVDERRSADRPADEIERGRRWLESYRRGEPVRDPWRE